MNAGTSMIPRAAAVTPSSGANVRKSVRAKELVSLLSEHPEVKVLSLDCFDTILWRNTAAPTDVFYDLANAPAFSAIGLNARMRVMAEGKARDLKMARTGLPEVTLAEIYGAAFPGADVAALAEEELAAEIAACAPHPEAIELIRAAHLRGLAIVVVSDTYFTEAELRRLLQATIPADAYAAISEVFVSSAVGKPKAGGMFESVLAGMNERGLRACDVLHVGDNLRADFTAARARGMNACHLVHHGAEIEEVLRMQTTAASLLMPSLREGRGLPSPYRGLLAAEVTGPNDPIATLGYASLGPVLHAFATWLGAELDALKSEGKNPKPIFLLRDGYLPARVAEAMHGAPLGPLVSISRFASFAASFRTVEDIEQYVAAWSGGGRFFDVARQLLLTEDEARSLITRTRKAERQAEAFCREVLKPKTAALILARSASYRKRLFAHVIAESGIAAGDTLVLVDLGYEGTAQRQLTPVLEAGLGVEVQGRYLLAARVPGWEKTRKGLLDPSWCDDRLLSTLVTYIALLENLCAADTGSTVDYTDAGAPIRAKSLVAADQTARVKPVQDACERFARDAETYFVAAGKRPSAEDLRTTAVASLARMLLLPTRSELDYLAGFCLDMNLGADDNLALFDAERGLQGLRRHGLFFLGAESAQAKTTRIAGPVELRAASLELSLTMVAQQRFGLEMTPNDMTHRREPLGILALRGETPIRAQVEARATHDGWFSAIVPYSATDAAIGFLLGERNAWVQVESVTRIAAAALYTANETESSEDVSANLHAEGMTRRGPGLFECHSPDGFLLLAAPPPADPRAAYVCRIVFRPIAPRVAA